MSLKSVIIWMFLSASEFYANKSVLWLVQGLQKGFLFGTFAFKFTVFTSYSILYRIKN